MSHSNQAVLESEDTSDLEEIGAQLPDSSSQNHAANDSDVVSPADMIFEKLNQASVNHRVEELEKEMESAIKVAGDLALQGQITIWFAGPNTGKTLLALKLVAEAKQKIGDDLMVYHLNLDDDQRGMIDKANLGNRCGFRVLSPEIFSNPIDNFKELVLQLIEVKGARRTLLILDTTKKFTDVMDKGRSSEFMTLCRRFTSAGGTIIGLAHTNKHDDCEGRPIPGGTSDLRDDSDCAYVMQIDREDRISGGVRRYVKFTNIKARGAVVREATYFYDVNDDGDYPRMFYSVKQANAGEVAELTRQTQIKQEQENDKALIQAIQKQLSKESWTKTALVKVVHDTAGASKQQVVGCLERWSCASEDGGLWVKSKGENNAKIYTLSHTP